LGANQKTQFAKPSKTKVAKLRKSLRGVIETVHIRKKENRNIGRKSDSRQNRKKRKKKGSENTHPTIRICTLQPETGRGRDIA